MRILLIQPAKSPVSLAGEDVHIFEPLALEYIAAGIAADDEVRILDQRLDEDVQGALEEFRPDVVGITSYTVHVKVVKKLFEEVKKRDPRVLTVVGGHHATVVPRDFISPSIDLIVMGEGVLAFREIVERHRRGEEFRGLPGVTFAEGSGLAATDGPCILDLDSLPFPRRDLTAKYRPEYYAEYMKPLASIRTSKGCPFRCSFCALWKIAGGRYLRRSPERIVEELAGIEEEFVFFADDESLVDVERMRTLARLIRDRGLRKRYYLYGRSDTIAKNRALLEAWKEVGLERVFVGLESFRDEDLRRIRKGSTTDDNREAARILKELGIGINASLIVRPDFTTKDFRSLSAYCRSLDLGFAGFAVLTPLPGTEFYEEVEDRLLTRDCEFYDLIHTVLPTALPLPQFYEEYYRLYRKAIPFRKTMSFMMKFPLREIPGALGKGIRWLGRVRRAHEDYGGAR